MATLKLFTGSIEDLSHTPNEEGLKSVLVLSGKLVYESACKLECEGMLFDGKKRARAFNGPIKLPKGMKDVELALPTANGGWDTLQCHIPKLQVEHIDNPDDEILVLTVRAHFDANHADLLAFVSDKRKATFDWEVRRRQGDLFDEVEAEQVEPVTA